MPSIMGLKAGSPPSAIENAETLTTLSNQNMFHLGVGPCKVTATDGVIEGLVQYACSPRTSQLFITDPLDPSSGLHQVPILPLAVA